MSKFEIGDKVIYDGRIAEIFGVANKTDFWGKRYAITFQYESGNLNNCVVREEDLQSAEIEIGDIVEDNDRYIGKVISIADKNTDWKIGIYDKNFTERYENLQAAYIHDLKLVKKIK